MILTALNDYYERLVSQPESEIAPLGYSYEKISFALIINRDGRLIDLMDLRDTFGKMPRPSRKLVPQPETRTSGVKPLFLWDKSSYVLGVSDIKEDDEAKFKKRLQRVHDEHEAFRARHEEVLAGTEDEGLLALLGFLRGWRLEDFQQSSVLREDVLDSNLVFRLDGEQNFIHERSAAQVLQANAIANTQAPEGVCLVTGDRSPISRVHPSIKGVKGAQSSGAYIVSFNDRAYESYGKAQGDNAPISERVAFAYTTVLNHLLRNEPDNYQRLQIGDATTVFWAITEDQSQAQAAEQTFAQILDPPSSDESETERLKRLLESVARGQPLREQDPSLNDDTQIYVLGLAPNASRLSIRYWETGSLQTFARRVAQHYQDLNLAPQPWKTFPGIWRLPLETTPHRGTDKKGSWDDIPPKLSGELTRSILTGRRYPRSLLTNIIMRMRTDGDISGLRVALCKGVLMRDRRLGVEGTQEEVPVSLDKENTNPGYRLGRLFAALERAQRAALGDNLNATIRDRYYGAASATPASIFPVLLRNAQHHLGRLRKDKPGLAVNLEKEIGEIMDGLGSSFPKSLRLESQGQFAIGYYHQFQSHFRKPETAEQGEE
ncbi:type I-C CRISPR-associated protein Cas8c/Csd1 [Spiribacter salinus]|uniref:type I-C CRISPR-associated protein Cas8c/Csd1 n=1 Tax=Spiribacter salinus TaxID=1335746 RepID=UPI001C947221|nr:type I-C CRISPR-associated protein Cas8c/Csd1 [Spiribacter salinus]MBY5268291.1 type I-C CRISPR-associated protein Cas8c/Csd1 [Spiribacter salinus]